MALSRAHTSIKESVRVAITVIQRYRRPLPKQCRQSDRQYCTDFNRDNFNFYIRDAVSAVLATVTCLAGWLAIWKSFPPSESNVILVSWDPCADTKFHGEPLQRAVLNTRGVGKIGDFCIIFYGHRRLSRKRCEIGWWLLWNLNRKSWVPNWMV